MHILRKCKVLLSYAGLGDNCVRIGERHISKTAIQWLVVSVNVFSTLQQLLICQKYYESGLQAMLFPLHVVIVITSKVLLYISLIRNASLIDQLFIFLQELVTERTFSYVYYLVWCYLL